MTSSSLGSFSCPRPRPPKSPAHLAQIRVQNRRRAWLDKHPEYFQSSEHELADPLLYDHLIRRFQTQEEREAENRAKGYARVLEGSLLRGEERMARLRAQTVQEERERARQQQQEQGQGTGVDGVRVTGETAPKHTFPPNGGHARAGPSANTNGMGDDDIPGTTLSSLNADLLPPPTNKEEGRAQWEEFLRDRFIRGEDDDFDYSLIDDNDEYDVLERQEQEEAWFDEEEPEWASSCGEEGEGGGRVLKGETGVQDF